MLDVDTYTVRGHFICISITKQQQKNVLTPVAKIHHPREVIVLEGKIFADHSTSFSKHTFMEWQQ